ncbi:metal ABC transporter substrate-binding protein [Halarcobacter anaerophilus]|uniref:ABC transporter substrate-binding protein n=1 Tax=Halarcobacter anaerophilus TaxID=877500 RepID=A0A4V1LPL8_9BACT|nr:zinc ABC transporter substrate-binding protein [Halarcobacter anaerophilus]QDF28439.1 periplasmic substrate-binding protein, ZnuA family [Halarcobacter anaerophilus]RXJ61648.1 hypothetical protein CRV06_12630 [Halarcobacter anaerophilus]
MYKIFFILLLFSTSLFSFTSVTVTYPIEYFFLKKIVGSEIYITTITENKETFALDSKNIKKFSNNNYYFNFNLQEEEKLSTLLKKNGLIKSINMIKGLPTLKLANGKSNPYIWLDPILARGIAKNVYINMIKIIPSKQKIFEKNYKEFLKELDKVYLDIKKRIDKSDLYGFFSFNNQLDYFAKRFRINIYHKEEKILNIQQAKELIAFSKKEYIKHILIPENSDSKVAYAFKGYIDGKVVEYDIYSQYWKVNLYRILRGIENF